MDKISLKNTLPNVFLSRVDVQSEVWRQDILFERGRIYLVQASSGTGKSSMCSFITGQRTDYQGDILFDDRNIRQMSDKEWVEVRRRHLSLLFQELRLFPELTAMENVLIKNQLTHHLDETVIREWFERLEIGDRADTRLGLMSYGQQQRVAMIRSLAQPFDFIFLDEPVSHLDEHNSALMAELLLQEAQRQNAGIIITSIGKHMNIKYDKVIRL